MEKNESLERLTNIVADFTSLVGKRLPDFDVRNFGFRKLTSFVKSLGDYEHAAQGKQIYFRARA